MEIKECKERDNYLKVLVRKWQRKLCCIVPVARDSSAT